MDAFGGFEYCERHLSRVIVVFEGFRAFRNGEQMSEMQYWCKISRPICYRRQEKFFKDCREDIQISKSFSG
ncbi:hypothetical protein KQX54_015567 [Cotesia glomerata]|uniref:Uncharacterized protein n=1 Tax=Cotesia glomerata TaxID=32391 RepID=A0AAV7I3M9_COTGL|nr:hypothetical protein KQX54_015567 [Cotesia glomerata]